MDAVHEDERVYRVQGPGLPFFYLREDLICDLADHLRGQIDPIQLIQLVVDVPGTHPAGIKGDYLVLNTGYIPLVFRDQFWFKFPVPVPGHINLEFPILAL